MLRGASAGLLQTRSQRAVLLRLAALALIAVLASPASGALAGTAPQEGLRTIDLISAYKQAYQCKGLVRLCDCVPAAGSAGQEE